MIHLKAKQFNVKLRKKELDTLWSKKIRALFPTCQKCGKTGSTQAAHIFGRGNLTTRWELKNGIGLCFYCHLYWAHRAPVEFTLWIMERMGKGPFTALEKKARKQYDSSNFKVDFPKFKEQLTSLQNNQID